MGQNRGPLWRSPVLKQDRGQLLGGGSWGQLLRVLASCLWVGQPLKSRGKGPATRAVVCGGSPLPGGAVPREVLPRLAIFFYQWTWGLQTFCGHFHAEPTQFLTGEVRVDKPSGPRSRLPLPGCSCRRPHRPGCRPASRPPASGLGKGSGAVQSSGPRSRVSLHSPSHSEMGSKANSQHGERRKGVKGVWMRQSWAPLVSMASCGVGQNLAKKEKRKSNKQNHHQQKHSSLYSLQERTEKDPDIL